jgi:hypothetical protein
MPALTFTPSMLSFTLIVPGGPYESAASRAVTAAALLQSDSRAAVVSGANAALTCDTVHPGWLTIAGEITDPANVLDGVPFVISVSSIGVEPGLYEATIRATAGGFSDATCDVTFRVDFEGHPVRRVGS